MNHHHLFRFVYLKGLFLFLEDQYGHQQDYDYAKVVTGIIT